MAKYTAAMNQALDLINKQYSAISSYYDEAGAAFEQQYKGLYGQTMQNAVNALASSGIYESPVSQNQLNRTQSALAETYATGKSQLAGQRLSAESAVDQQRISYYQNLANLQYQQARDKAARKSGLFGSIGGLGGTLLGSLGGPAGAMIGGSIGSNIGSGLGSI